MPVEVALTSDGQWESGTGQLVEAAHQAGFTALGVHASRAGSEAAAAYDSAGMRCHELLALLFSDDEPATLASATKQAEAAALVGAEWVVFDATLRIRCGAACVVRFDPFLLSIGPSRTL